MRDFNFIKQELIKKHEIIDDIKYLDKYIDFIMNYKLVINTYVERHHILPKSIFPEFSNDYWNIIELDYEDHKLVHLYLFKAINIRTYQRPLNWMMSWYKNSIESSNAAKKGWDKLKGNDEKYKNFCDKRSDHMKTLSSDEQSRRAKIYWDNMSDEEYLEYCRSRKEYWTEERKIEKSNDMKEFYLDEKNIEQKRKEGLDSWNKLNEDQKKIFIDRISLINKGIEKRLDAGIKISKLWKDPQFLEKMKNRKHRSGLKLKIINEEGVEKFLDSLEDMVREYNFSLYKIRKYKDKNIKILKKDLKEENMILLNCIIETIK